MVRIRTVNGATITSILTSRGRWIHLHGIGARTEKHVSPKRGFSTDVSLRKKTRATELVYLISYASCSKYHFSLVLPCRNYPFLKSNRCQISSKAIVCTVHVCSVGLQDHARQKKYLRTQYSCTRTAVLYNCCTRTYGSADGGIFEGTEVSYFRKYECLTSKRKYTYTTVSYRFSQLA